MHSYGLWKSVPDDDNDNDFDAGLTAFSDAFAYICVCVSRVFTVRMNQSKQHNLSIQDRKFVTQALWCGGLTPA